MANPPGLKRKWKQQVNKRVAAAPLIAARHETDKPCVGAPLAGLANPSSLTCQIDLASRARCPVAGAPPHRRKRAYAPKNSRPVKEMSLGHLRYSRCGIQRSGARTRQGVALDLLT